MKQRSIWVVLLLSFTLISCALKQNPSFFTDYTQESWQREIETHSAGWKAGADGWFKTGDATLLEYNAPTHQGIRTTMMNVDDFSSIKVNGGFKVQIFGSDHNSVYLSGPEAGLSAIDISADAGALVVNANPNAPDAVTHVIIRIGVKHLNYLEQSGCGPIEAIHINSDSLTIAATKGSSGNVYLSGKANLKRVVQEGSGSINVFGAQTTQLEIYTFKTGGVNISGSVGVSFIEHHGANDINIIGANSSCLDIYADGCGKVGIQGSVKLRKVRAKDGVSVFLSNVNSTKVSVKLAGCARLGLAGLANVLNVEAFDSALFEGRYFCTQNAFVSTRGKSHVNMTACNKAFANARDYSSVYFFGPAYLLTKFQMDHSIILALEEPNACNYQSEYRPYSYTDSHKVGYVSARMDYKGEG